MSRTRLDGVRRALSLSSWGAAALVFSGCAAPDAIPGAPGSGPFPPPIDGGDPAWVDMFGHTGQPTFQRGYDVAIDKTTSTAVATFGFDNTIEIPDVAGTPFVSAGGLDVLVVSLSAATGKPVWAQRIGDAYEQTRTAVDVDIKGNVIVAGGFDSSLDIGLGPLPTLGGRDVFVAKLDASGKPVWLRTFGDTSQQFATDVATDGEGNVIVVGYTEGEPFPFEAGLDPTPKVTGNDIFITKLDPSGKTLWAERVGRAGSGDPNDPTACVAVSRADGSIVLGGAFSESLVFPDLQVPKLGDQDGFVVKLDKFGAGLWGTSFGASMRRQRVTAVAFGPSGSVLLTGGFRGDVSLGGEMLAGSVSDDDNLLVAKLDSAGKHVWSHGYGSDGDQIGRQIMIDASGSALVVGDFEGVLEFFGEGALINADVDGRWDIVAATFHGEDGAPIWGKKYGDRENQRVAAAVLDKDDHAVLVGTNEGKLSLGKPLGDAPTSGGEDAFVLSLSP